MLSTPAPRSQPRRAFRPRLNAVCSALALLALHSAGSALPQGGTPTFGQTTVKTEGNQMTIVQGSARAGIDWRSFSIGTGEGVSIRQPDARSTLFNRVLGTDPSLILGNLQSNGRVFLSNPRGVVFGQGSRVDVGSLVATTLSLSDEAMQAGRFDLQRGETTPGELTQDGQINATGTVALVSPSLVQRGSIAAPRIGLAAAESARIDVEGDGLIFFNVNTDSLDTRLQVLGSLKAHGGLADLRAQARAGFADTVLNMDGIVMARSAGLRNGRIHIDGGNTGITAVRGTLDASGLAPDETGGAVTVLGDKVGLFDAALVNASGAAGGGTVLVGGNYQGQGPERNASAAYVGPEVMLQADAVERGKGGRTIVWSDDSTRFYGAISARGGVQQGDGGFAEVSGKEFLDFAGTADLRAPRGEVGTLLLDPRNLTINNADDDSGFPANPSTPFVPNADSAVLTWQTIDAALGASDVVVTTIGSGGAVQAGDITISAASTGGGPLAGTNSLTLQAAGAIAVNANVSRADAGALTLQANQGITLQAGAAVSTDGGKVTMTSAGSGNMALAGSIATAGGDVTLSVTGAGNNLVLGGNINAGTTGTVRLSTAAGSIGQTGGAITAQDLSANAPLGSVVLPAAGNTIAGVVAGRADGTGGDFGVRAAGALTVGSVAGDGIAPAATGVSATDSISLSAATNLTIAEPLTTAGGVGLQAGAAGDITINANIGADVGDPALAVDRLVLRGGSVSAPLATVSADRVAIDGVDASSVTLAQTLSPLVAVANVDSYAYRQVAGDLVVPVVLAVTAGPAAGAGPLTVNGVSGISADDVRLQADAGAVRQDAGARIQATTRLAVTADDAIQLAEANLIGSGSSNAGILALNAGGNIVFSEAGGGYTIGQAPVSGAFTEVRGLQGGGVSVTLSTTAGEVLQQAGENVAATGLLLRGAAAYTLTNVGNTVGTLAADSGAGPIHHVDGDALTVGSVAGVDGITRTGEVSLRALSGSLTVAENINLGTATLRLQASTGSVTGGTVTAGAVGARAGNVDLGIDVGVAAAEGTNVRLTSSGSYAIGSVGDADSSIRLADGTLTVPVFQAADGLRAAVTIELDTAAGEVTQQAGGDLTALNLLLRGDSRYTLTNSGNAVSQLAADGDGAGGNGEIRYVNASALSVAGVAPVAGGGLVEGIDRASDVTLRTELGDLSLAEDIDIADATLRLSAAGGIAQTSGGITAAAVGARAGTSVSLTGINSVYDQAGDAHGVIAGEAADGSFKFYNTLDTRVAAISADSALFTAAPDLRAAKGATALNSDITLRLTDAASSHDLVLASDVDAGSAGTVRLSTANGSIGQTAGDITAVDLLALAPIGSVVLASEGNAVSGSVAGVAEGGSGDFGMQATGVLRVGSVNDDDGPATLYQGISAAADIVLKSTPGLVIDGPLTALGGVGLETDGAILVNADIAAGSLVLRGASYTPAAVTVAAGRVAGSGLDAASVAKMPLISNRVAAEDTGNFQFRLPSGHLIVAVVNDVVAGPAAGAGPLTVDGVSGITAAEVRLQADAGSVLQDPGALIQATSLLGAKASVGIDLGLDNLVGSGTTNAALLALSSPGDIYFKEAGGGYSLGSVVATGFGAGLVDAIQGAQTSGSNTRLELSTTGGEVLQRASGNIVAPQLLLRGPARYTLTNAGNAVGRLTADSDGGQGVINYVDTDALDVGQVTPVSGGAAVDGIARTSEVSLRTLSGDLRLLKNIDVGVDETVRLQATTGNVKAHEVGGGQVIAQTVGARALQNVELSLGRAVSLVSAQGERVLIVSPDGYAISAVSATDPRVRNTDDSVGPAVFEAVDGIVATATIELDTASGRVTQQADRDVVAAGLLLRGNAGYSLTNEDNEVATIAATSGPASISYVNSDTLVVGSVDAVSVPTAALGITRSGDVSLRTQSGDIELAENANVGTAMLRLQAAQGRVFGDTGTAIAGDLGARAYGNVDLDILVDRVSAQSETGNVRLASLGDYTVSAVVNSAESVLLATNASGGPVYEATVAIQAVNTIELDTESGEVTQQAGRDLTAANLLLRGAAAYSLTNIGNLVNTLAADTGGEAIRYVNAGALAVDSVAPVQAGDAINGIVRTGDVALRTVSGDLTLVESANVGTATLRLQAAAGDVLSAESDRTGLKGQAVAGTLGARASGDVDLDITVAAASAEGSNVRLSSGTGYAITEVGDADRSVRNTDGSTGPVIFEAVDGVSATTTIELDTASGEVTQQADRDLAAANLLLRGNAQYTLTNEDNAVGTLAADAGTGASGGAIRYVNAGSLSVGGVAPADGGNAVLGIVRTGDVALRALTGDLTLAESANVHAATLRLQAAGEVTSEEERTAAAAVLGVRAGGDVDLRIAAGAVSADGINVRLTAADAYAITAVADADRAVHNQNGSAGGTVFEAVDGIRADTTIELITAAGEVTQQTDRNIEASNLLLRGDAQYTLTNERNEVVRLAADSGGGAIHYVDATALRVDNVAPVQGGAAVQGISRGGDVALRTLTGDLSLAQDANVADATLRLQAAAGNVMTAPGMGTPGGTAIAGTLGASAFGNVDLAIAVGAVSAQGANVHLTSAGGYTITAVGDSDRSVLQEDGTAGVAVFQAVDGLRATTTAQLDTASGEVTQQADRHIAAANLLLRGAAQVSLTNAGNEVGTLAADTGTGAIRYVDADALVVGSVTPVAGAPAVVGMQRGGDVSLRTLAGDLSLAQNIDVGNATLRLQASAGNVRASTGDATVTAGALGARASGNVDLAIAVDTVSAEAANVRLTATGDYTVASVSDGDRTVAMTGGTDGGVVFQATDGLNAAGTIELSAASGEVTQQAGRDITAAALLLHGAAQYTLTNAGNSVRTLAADSGAGALRYVNAGALQVGGVTPVAGGAAVTGISRAGDVSLHTVSGDLTLASQVDAGATLRLQAAAGSITGTAAGLASAGAIGIRAAGTADLHIDAATVSAQASELRLTSAGGYGIGAVGEGDRNVSGANAGSVFQATDGLRAVNAVELVTASGTVKQDTNRDIAASDLLLRGGAAYTLTNAGNNVGTLAADAGAGAIRYVDADALTVAAVAPVADDAAVVGIGRSGDVTLRSVAGDLTLGASVDVGVAALRLQAAGNILQSGGAVSAGSLGAVAGQGITLKSPANDVGTVALQAGGDVWFEEANGYVVGEVTTDGPGFVGAQGIQASQLTGTVDLDTVSGEVTQTHRVAAAQLLLRGSAAYALDIGGGNSVGAFAATSGGSADGAISFRNAGALNLRPLAGPSNTAASGITRTSATTVVAGGEVTFEGQFVASGGSIVQITSQAAAKADTNLRKDEVDLFVKGRADPFDRGDLYTPDGTLDSAGNRVQIAGSVISQKVGSSVTVSGDTALRLTSSESGSITLAEVANDFSGGTVSARSGGEAVELTLAGGQAVPGPQLLLSRMEINGKVLNIGASGATTDVAGYGGEGIALQNASIGIEADLVRLGAEKITTGDNFIVARFGATSLQPYEYQLPGLAIAMGGPSTYVKDNFGAVGERKISATGQGPGLKVMVGYDPTRPATTGSAGWMMVLPSLFKEDGSLADGLGEFRSNLARISLSGPVVATPTYVFSSPGVQATVPVYYNGETPLDPAQRSALSAIDSLQERLRREQVEQSVSTENVARDLRQGVIVEVGTGPAATSGSGAKPPETCGPAVASLACAP